MASGTRSAKTHTKDTCEKNLPGARTLEDCQEAQNEVILSTAYQITHGKTADPSASRPGYRRGGAASGGAQDSPKGARPKTQRPGTFLSNRFATSDAEDAVIRNMRGESQEEVLHTDIMAAVEAETDTILSDFGTEELTKIVLITIKAAVPAIVKAVQKQLLSTVDSNRLNRNILESRFKEDELEQYSRKENVRISGIDEEPNGDEPEDLLVEKVCKLAAAAGANIKEHDISTAHRLGGSRKQGKTRPVIIRFVSRRKKTDLMKNKSVLRSNDAYKNIFICDDLTRLRYKLLKIAKEKCQHTFIREGRVICKYEGRYLTINNPDDLFLIGLDDVDYKTFGIDL
ncbi:hypothetical protein WMY93_014296 [Mugilogobius chulae]|uniref:Uncharacterized protein n=1 Tax=Mugilogobius chulae TaxID=88201 RepID=A0AAW0P5L5_9GOBI